MASSHDEVNDGRIIKFKDRGARVWDGVPQVPHTRGNDSNTLTQKCCDIFIFLVLFLVLECY